MGEFSTFGKLTIRQTYAIWAVLTLATVGLAMAVR